MLDLLATLNALIGLIGGTIAIGTFITQARKRGQEQRILANTLRPTMPLPRLQNNGNRPTFLTHPVILTLGIATTLTTYAIQASHVPNPSPVATLYGLCLIVQLSYWIYILRQTLRLRRWGWFIGMLLTLGWSGIIYGLWGPTHPKPIPSSPPMQQERL